MSDSKEILPDVKNIKQKETYTLPSKGLVYNPTDNIPTSVTLKRMTTKEEKIRLRNQGEDKTRIDLLNACIEENFDAGKLKLDDANYLLFKLRVLSLLDDTYKVSCVCPHCGAEFIHEINLNDLSTIYMDETKFEKFNVELPISKARIDLHLPSLNEIQVMAENTRDYMNKFPNADLSEVLFTTSVAVYIDKVNGNDLMYEEVENYIENMDILDVRFLRKCVNSLDNLFRI